MNQCTYNSYSSKVQNFGIGRQPTVIFFICKSSCYLNTVEDTFHQIKPNETPEQVDVDC